MRGLPTDPDPLAISLAEVLELDAEVRHQETGGETLEQLKRLHPEVEFDLSVEYGDPKPTPHWAPSPDQIRRWAPLARRDSVDDH